MPSASIPTSNVQIANEFIRKRFQRYRNHFVVNKKAKYFTNIVNYNFVILTIAYHKRYILIQYRLIQPCQKLVFRAFIFIYQDDLEMKLEKLCQKQLPKSFQRIHQGNFISGDLYPHMITQQAYWRASVC